MARAPQQTRRKQRPQPRSRKAARHPEDLMFFSRLRRRAKWVFLLLAIAFALSFLVAGVGTGFGSGIGDYFAEIFNRQPGATDASVEELRERVAEQPNDAELQLQLAGALEAERRTGEAVAAYERYLELRPDDADALERLGSLHSLRAQEAYRRGLLAQSEGQEVAFGQALAFGDGPLAQAVAQDPIAEAVAGAANARAQEAFGEAQERFEQAAGVFERASELQADDPYLFFQLAQASQFAGDIQRAILAYERFLELAPEDPNAETVRELLEQLRGEGASG